MKCILFDLGNVLIPYSHRRVLEAVAACCGATTAAVEALHRELGPALGLGHVTPAAYFDLVRNRTGAHAVGDAELAIAACAGLQRDDDALAYAVALQARPGVDVGVISNTNAIHVAWLDEKAPELAQFELVIFSNEVALQKPDPEIYALALELLEVAPGNVLFVDDLPENVAAAQALGMAGIVHAGWEETRPAIERWLGEGPSS